MSLDFFHKNIILNGKNIRVQIFDTNGTERFNSMTCNYLRKLHGCFIIFDITDNESFNDVNRCIQLYKDYNEFDKKIMIILGNKNDLKERKITFKKAQNLADNFNLIYLEASAKNITTINEAFNIMIEEILKSEEYKTKLNKNNSQKLSELKLKKQSIMLYC